MMNTEKNNKKHLLIVEDDKSMVKIYEYMLSSERERYTYDIACSAAEGEKLMEENEYDLIILDVIMDEVRGDEFFIRLRRVKGIDTPIIFVTVCDMQNQAYLGSINNYLVYKKPITKKGLLEKIGAMTK